MGLFGLLKGKSKVGGSLGYFGLGEWWLSTFTEAERTHIEQVYKPLGMSPRERPLTQGSLMGTSQTAAGLLWALAGWFNKPGDRHIAERILAKAEELADASGNPLDRHFTYLQMIETAYRQRDEVPGALGAATRACEKQIALAPKASRAFKREYKGQPLPPHTGFQQLAIIREKQGDLDGALRLAEQAKRQGWAGDWDGRIARLQKKKAKG